MEVNKEMDSTEGGHQEGEEGWLRSTWGRTVLREVN
jgi:hypothetical protein